MNRKLEKNRNRYTGDNCGAAANNATDKDSRKGEGHKIYCIEIKTGPREKIKLSFAYAAMRQGLLQHLGQAREEMEIKLFTEGMGNDGQAG